MASKIDTSSGLIHISGSHLIEPLLAYHGRVISTFEALPAEGRLLAICIKIGIIIIAPLAYLALGFAALIGLALNYFQNHKEQQPDPTPDADKASSDSSKLDSSKLNQNSENQVENFVAKQLNQDTKLKTWNDEFKTIAKGDPNSVNSRLKSHRVSLYAETKIACENGFYVNKKKVNLDSDFTTQMINETVLLNPVSLPNIEHEPYQTVFEVLNEDTVALTKQYQELGLNPVALNLANAKKPGGGVERAMAFG